MGGGRTCGSCRRAEVREAAPAWERAEMGEDMYQECNKFVRFTDCL